MSHDWLGIEATGGGRALHARRRVGVAPSEQEAREPTARRPRGEQQAVRGAGDMVPASGSLVFFLPGPGEGGPSQSERRVSTVFSMPAQFEAWLRVKHGSSPLGALIPFSVDTAVVRRMTALDWSERSGPRVRVSGELIFTKGLDARLDLHPAGGRGESANDGTQVQLIGPGTTLYSAEKTLEASIPGSS